MGLQSWQFASLSLHLLPLVWILVSGTFSPCVAKMPLHSSRITSFLFHWIYWGDIGSQNHTGFKCTTQQKHHHHTASFFVAFDARKREGRDRESDPFFFCQTATLIQENILTSSAWILNSLLRSVTREKGSHNQFGGNGDQTSNTGMTDRQFTQGEKKGVIFPEERQDAEKSKQQMSTTEFPLSHECDDLGILVVSKI